MAVIVVTTTQHSLSRRAHNLKKEATLEYKSFQTKIKCREQEWTGNIFKNVLH